MVEVAPGLWHVPLLPLDTLNVYLLGDVLIDSGATFSRRQILRALRGKEVRAHALTHAHMDHQGSSHAICEALKIPLWCGQGDREAMETGDLGLISPAPRSPVGRFGRMFAGEGHPVSRTLLEGDQIGDFTVIETPGHSPGHLSFWRESDRALVLGDVAFSRSFITLRKYIHEPFAGATYDVGQNRASARKVAELGPELICFGHGPPHFDGQEFEDYVRTLPN